MLVRLEIQNYAIIDHLDIQLSAGMNIITGETGAGKSIVLGALGLIMGNRADTKVLFNAEKKCFVEATFKIDQYALQSFFTENDLPYEDELLVRREIAPGGKSRAFVNDSPCTLDILQSLSTYLVDIHQQFDTSQLRTPQYQIDVIDALSISKEDKNSYRQLFREYQESQKILKSRKESNENEANEREFLQFQYNELAALNLTEGETIALESKLSIMEAAEEIKTATTTIYTAISDNENSIASQIQQLYALLSNVKNVDDKCLGLYDRLRSLREEIIDIAQDSEKLSDQIEYDPQGIQKAQQRISSIYKLQKKHNAFSDTELLTTLETLKSKIESRNNTEEYIALLEKKIDEMHKALLEKAAILSAARKKAVPSVEREIDSLLHSLAMPNAKVKFHIENHKDLTINGIDFISLQFSANKGSQLSAIKDVASGGELSRLALCVKSVTAHAMTMPTLVLDEIDSGISGEVAHKMGLILGKLAQEHQMICITHSPQIAAKAHQHYWVYKQETETRTLTAVKILDENERILEIAKMLSGDPPSAAAIANAKDLLAS
jgi:DNA repair protein RecN (Recombination protein N)